MKRITLLAAAAAMLAAPAVFAQSAATVVQGGTVLLEGPATSKPIHGAVIAEAPVIAAPGVVAVAPVTSVLGGPAAVVTTANPPAVLVQHYWNVPPNIRDRMDFQRWRRLM